MEDLYETGLVYMSRLNRNGGILMLKHGATASTDVTGFGIMGHSQNLVDIQKYKNQDWVFERLPCFKGLKDLDKIVRDFGLVEGKAAETSGGLLIAMPADSVEDFTKDMAALKEDVWVVGKVVEGTGKTVIADCVLFDSH